jgi:hypothetical protein
VQSSAGVRYVASMPDLTEDKRRSRGIIGATATIAVFVILCGIAVYWRLEVSSPRANNFRETASEKKK